MNYVAPGLRELGRTLDRLSRRLRLVWERRKLAQLESRLGLLGWQQADFGADALHHVEHLAGLEREQARLTNESAALGLTLQQLEERRASEKTTFESQRAERNVTREPLVAPVEEMVQALGAKQKECKEIEGRISTLDREKTADEERYRVLLAKGGHSPQQEAEVERLRVRLMALPRESEDWQQKRMSLQMEIPRLETELEQRRALLSVETDALRALEKSFADSDKALAEEIAAHKRDKQKLEKRINALEKTKTQPYREIGRVLADQEIEPANQPEALTAVLTQREHIVTEEARIVESLESSRREKHIEVWGSWALLFTFAVLLWGALWFTLKAR